MRRRLFACVAVLMLSVAWTAARQGGADVTGTWTGKWDGPGATGGFELTLENKNGAMGGNVSVSGEPAYKATLKTVKVDGKKLAATYDFTPDDRAEVLLDGTLDGSTLKGTWTLRSKSDSTTVATGGWTVTKK
jgi:hypothetical protein